MILVLDNYDSFTWNLVQYIGALGGDPIVCRNDQVSVAEVRDLAPNRIVISPGPGTPEQAGITVELIRALGAHTPVLGVCLGHQAIAVAYGGQVVRARRLMHGKVSPVRHEGAALFAGVPERFEVTRYHSLVVEPATWPACLQPIAWTAEPGWEHELQALRHREHPVWGVQFHPESIASQSGMTIIRNFLENT